MFADWSRWIVLFSDWSRWIVVFADWPKWIVVFADCLSRWWCLLIGLGG